MAAPSLRRDFGVFALAAACAPCVTPCLMPGVMSVVMSGLTLGGCASTGGAIESHDRADRKAPIEERFRFTSGGLDLEAAADVPARARSNGWGVLLVGGGLGNDLDWSVPGSIVVEGAPMQMTITGEPHNDAPVLSRALAETGFTVLRWSTIAADDPLRNEWPVRATPRTLGELLMQARDALATLRRMPGVDPDRIIVIGHSLGAARAWTLAADDAGVRALVLLSPAYFTSATKPPVRFTDAGMRVGEEVIRDRRIATLAIFGADDASKPVDRDGAARLVGTKGYELLEARTLDGVGHTLGPQKGTLYGPISPEVVEMVADWADERLR